MVVGIGTWLVGCSLLFPRRYRNHSGRFRHHQLYRWFRKFARVPWKERHCTCNSIRIAFIRYPRPIDNLLKLNSSTPCRFLSSLMVRDKKRCFALDRSIPTGDYFHDWHWWNLKAYTRVCASMCFYMYIVYCGVGQTGRWPRVSFNSILVLLCGKDDPIIVSIQQGYRRIRALIRHDKHSLPAPRHSI